MSITITGIGPSVLRTFTFPDANATVLTTANVVTPAQGGTGLSSFTIGDLLYASGAAVLASLADVAAGSVLVSGGVGAAPAWSATPSVTNLTSTGVVKCADGNAGTPSLTFSSDPDTGFFWKSSGSFAVASNGVDRVTFLPSGGGSLWVETFSVGNIFSAPWVQIQTSAAGKLMFSGTTPMLQVGGSTSSFPALKRDTVFVQLRLADDSAVSGAATASLPAAAAARDGIIGFDTTLNALVYYVGGSRFKLTGTSF